MDKQIILWEFKGLSRVVDHDVRRLGRRHMVLTELADDYEPVNPFLDTLDQSEWHLHDSILLSMHKNLSNGECAAFIAQWQAMSPSKQYAVLVEHIGEGVA